MDSETRVCTKCGECKQPDQFFKVSGSDIKRMARCKTCHRAMVVKAKAARLSINPDVDNEKARIKYAASGESQRARARAWKSTNKGRVSGYADAYRSSNRQRLNDQQRGRYFKGKEVIKGRYRDGVCALSDAYVKHSICANDGTMRADVPAHLVELKREQLTIYRLSKQLTNAAKQLENENEAIANNR